MYWPATKSWLSAEVQVSFAYTAPAEAAFVRGFVRLYDVPPAFAGSATVYVDDWATLVQ